jgi:hypothetical protein
MTFDREQLGDDTVAPGLLIKRVWKIRCAIAYKRCKMLGSNRKPATRHSSFKTLDSLRLKRDIQNDSFYQIIGGIMNNVQSGILAPVPMLAILKAQSWRNNPRVLLIEHKRENL